MQQNLDTSNIFVFYDFVFDLNINLPKFIVYYSIPWNYDIDTPGNIDIPTLIVY